MVEVGIIDEVLVEFVELDEEDGESLRHGCRLGVVLVF